MRVSVLIGTFGDVAWSDLGWSRAYPSAQAEVEQQSVRGEVIKHHDPEGTLASVRNGLAEEASGDWLCFLDADDELAPGYLVAMAETVSYWRFYTNDETIEIRDLLVPRVAYVHADGSETAPAFPNRGKWPEMNTAVIGTVVPRALFLDVGGFHDGEYEDYDLWLRCDRAGARQVEVSGAVYRAHVSSKGRNSEPETARARHQAHLRLLREHRDWMMATT